MKTLLKGFLRLYQLTISPFLGPCCRFYPSCSEYAHEALETHGTIRGTWLTLKRLAKCGPWHPGGVDLVPDSKTRKL
ncbi:MAG: putative membrane protein insertion efficiency factor [Chlamydiae bacterium]|nr:putative membrane protein insertion efficiency factor [Chlamydiota bacterium]